MVLTRDDKDSSVPSVNLIHKKEMVEGIGVELCNCLGWQDVVCGEFEVFRKTTSGENVRA